MARASSRIHGNHEDYREKIENCNNRQAKTMIDSKTLPHTLKNDSDSCQIIGKIDKKSLKNKPFFDNIIFKIFRVMSLALPILSLCYHGRMEYSLLENGQIFYGFSSRKSILTFSLGYSVKRSVISVIAAGMLVYSIILKRPQYSLPFMGLFLAELVYDFCNAIVIIWYLFGSLRLHTAMIYAAGILVFIFTEIWTWLGVLQLYEYQHFQPH